MKTASVWDVISVMEKLAPPELAEQWDNPGLQVGDDRRQVRNIWVALDASPPVVDAACCEGIDMLITHHPLLIRPVKSIDVQTPFGKIVQKALRHNLAVFSAHTNLDAVSGGINDMLARRLELQDIDCFSPASEPNRGVSHFGIGRIGNLRAPMTLIELSKFVKLRTGPPHLKIVGHHGLTVCRVAVCSGSGSGIMADFFASDAHVLISGDVKYHDARDAESLNRALIDIGHFASEHLMLDVLAQRVQQECDLLGYELRVQACRLEKDPFAIV
ncbi:MAG: Nif3-like dinuclear metal center hexameric protein [Desulfobacterales bacterium]